MRWNQGQKKKKKAEGECGQSTPLLSYSEMATNMTNENASEDDDPLVRFDGGDGQAMTELFTRHRERLRRMIRLRLDRRLQGRIDSSDVLDDAFLEVARRVPEYLAEPSMPPFLWIRFLTDQTLQALHRYRLKLHMRDAGQKVSLRRRSAPQASSASLAALLVRRAGCAGRARLRRVRPGTAGPTCGAASRTEGPWTATHRPRRSIRSRS